MLPHLEAILAHLGAMFPISGTYVGSSRGYVCHIWDLCWVIWRASVRSSWSTFSAIDVGAPDTHEMSINPVRAARITDTTLEKHRVFAFLHLRRVAFSTRIKHSVFYTSHTQTTVNYVGQRWVGGGRRSVPNICAGLQGGQTTPVCPVPNVAFEAL